MALMVVAIRLHRYGFRIAHLGRIQLSAHSAVRSGHIEHAFAIAELALACDGICQTYDAEKQYLSSATQTSL
jgi:hypothetical protein